MERTGNYHLPPYDKFPELETENLLMRQIRLDDVDDGMVEIAYFDGQKASDQTETVEMIEKIEGLYVTGDLIHWGIFQKTDGALVGSCGYYRGFKDGAGEIGGILRPEYRHQGVMQPAIEAAIRFAFETMGLQEVFAITSKENQPAQKLLEKLGFAYESDYKEKNLRYIYQGEFLAYRA